LDDPGFVSHLTTAIGSANEAEKAAAPGARNGDAWQDGDWHLTEIVEVRKMMIGLKKSVLRKMN
jgi:hypothetical protein